MNEENALKTTEEPCAPAACWPDAKREADKMTASAAPPLAGRSQCRACDGWGCLRVNGPFGKLDTCPICEGTGVERSVPANKLLSDSQEN